MRKRSDPCGCIVRFLSQFPQARVENLHGLSYEDETCHVECRASIIKAQSYEVINGKKYKDGECIVTLW